METDRTNAAEAPKTGGGGAGALAGLGGYGSDSSSSSSDSDDSGDGDGGGPSNAAMSGIDEDAPPPAKKAAVLSMAI